MIFSFLLVNKNITEPVKNRHAWALADRFAISLGFLENGFDFFHPEPKCLNPQFPAGIAGKKTFWTHPISGAIGITAIDFPIHHYIVSGIMYFLNTNETFVFRLYMLTLSLLGLFYLFKSAMLITSSFYYSLFLTLFILLSPTFSYYSVGFLTSQASFSILLISLYHYIKYTQTKKNTYFIFTILLLTLASLARFPFLIYLIGFLSLDILLLFTSKKIEQKRFLLSLSSICIVLLYFFYNKLYLFERFGSNFLNYPLPSRSLEQLYEVIKGTLYHQSWRYFTLAHYIIMAVLLVKVIKRKSKLSINPIYKEAILYLGICSFGVFLYMILMSQQFVAHEYYLLDTFLPILIFLSLGCFQFFKNKKFKKALVVFCFFGFILNRVVYEFGYAERKVDPLETTRKNFMNSERTLDSLHIDKNKYILLLDSKSPNLAFINMNRKGYSVMNSSYENIKESLNWSYDYIITQNFTYRDEVLLNYPNFEKETTVFFTNDKFTIHTKK
jgi:hypothetical protein